MKKISLVVVIAAMIVLVCSTSAFAARPMPVNETSFSGLTGIGWMNLATVQNAYDLTTKQVSDPAFVDRLSATYADDRYWMVTSVDQAGISSDTKMTDPNGGYATDILIVRNTNDRNKKLIDFGFAGPAPRHSVCPVAVGDVLADGSTVTSVTEYDNSLLYMRLDYANPVIIWNQP